MATNTISRTRANLRPRASISFNRNRLYLAMSCLLITSLIATPAVGALGSLGTATPSSLKDFRISSFQSFLIVQPGSSVSTSLGLLSVNGFSGTVKISASIAPPFNGSQTVSLTLNPDSVRVKPAGNASSILTVSTTLNTPRFNFTVTVLAQAANLSHSVTVIVILPQPNFSISLSPSNLAMTTGSSRSSISTLTSLNGFAGQVTISALNIPLNVGVGISPSQVNLLPGSTSTSQVFVNVGSNAVPGTYSVTISGTAPFAGGFLTQTATLTLAISQTVVPDFSLTLGPNSITVLRGSIGFVNVTLSSIGGFNGTVSMTASIVPPVPGGPILRISPAVVSLGPGGTVESVLKIFTNSTTTLGSYNYTATGTSGSLFHTAFGSLLITSSSPGDFSLFTSPNSIVTAQNSTRSFGVVALSLNGFAGNVSLSTSNVPSGVALQFLGPSPPTLHVPSGGNGTIIGVLTVGINSVAGNYSIRVTGISGSLTHTATLLLTISSTVGPDFSITINPSVLTLTRPATGSINITVRSIGGFTGSVSIGGGFVPAVPPGVTFGTSPGTVFLQSGGTASSAMRISTNTTTPIGIYNVSMVGTSGSLIHQVFGSLSVTNRIIESLTLINYAFNSTTAVTLNLGNSGNVSISFVAYSVRDASGNQYALTAWSGPAISSHTSFATLILIGSSCPSCVLSGSPFIFTPGNSYTITLVTSRSNQFTFTIVR